MTKKTLLLVEDDPDDVLLTQRAFQEIGFPYDVVVAHDGAEAMDFLFATGIHAKRKIRAKPSFILMDLKMPKVGGLELLQRFKSYLSLKDVEVAILTSSDAEKDKARAKFLGALHYFRKPVDFEQFLGIARQVQQFMSTAH
jgi:two-component system response regulator